MRLNPWIDTLCSLRRRLALTWVASIHLRHPMNGHPSHWVFPKPARYTPSWMSILRPIFTPTKPWRPAILLRETCGETS